MVGLSSSIAVLLEKLDAVLKLPGFTKENKNSVLFLEKLGSALKSISKVNTDTDWRQLHYRSVKSWHEDLEDAVYDADDVLDEILYEATRFKLEATEPNKKRMRSVKEIVEEAIAKKKGQFGFSEVGARIELPLPESDSLPVSNEPAIYGREEERSKVVRFLLSSGDGTIALVGKEGVGKTTLAKLVFHDEKVSVHFELKAWIGVGLNFDVHGITRKILEDFTRCSFEGNGLYELQRKLRASLAKKKFLLVLDDVRKAQNISEWRALQSSLISGARGSKVIVTTSSDRVAAVMGCSFRFSLDPLGVKDCLSILKNSAFVGRDKSEVESLEVIGRKIVERCQGLPLVARTIGGLLRFKRTRQEWLDVLEYLENKSSNSVFDIQRLIYYHLPAQLKRCFAYCSLFPRESEFDNEELVLLWMAEGFLLQSTVQPMEKVGAECFTGLLKRSFFIPGENSRFKTHDLMHDLAEYVSEEVCFRLESRLSNTTAIPKRTRHLSLLSSQHDNAGNLNVIPETNRLRTFYLINSPSGHGSCQLSPEALKVIFARQQRLRVLSLPHFQHAELPASIGELKHLRYLNVSDSALKRLPESLCTLYYLQTLILTNCSSLLMLPQGIVELVHLRKLHIKRAGLKQMPQGMGRLTSLQSLSNFIVGHGGSSIKELGALPNLHGSLSVSMLQNVSSTSDAPAANLKDMKYLDELELEWSCNYENSTDQEEVLENLKPSRVLKKLSIRYYGGTVFPNWLGDSTFLNITSLHLGDCRNCELLPPLGRLSLLEHLIIERFSRIVRIGHEFYGVDVSGCKPFQSLKTLKFGEMTRWEWWKLPEAEGEEFPRLEELYIINCPVFRGGLPESLPNLTKLEITKCEKLAASLPWTSEHCVLKLDMSCQAITSTLKIGFIAKQPRLSPSLSQILKTSTSACTRTPPWRPKTVLKSPPPPPPPPTPLGYQKQKLICRLPDPGPPALPHLYYKNKGVNTNSELQKTQDKILPNIDGQVASQVSSSTAQISGNELQLEWNGAKENPTKGRAVQEDPKPIERLEKPSIGFYGGTSDGGAVQEDSEPSERLEKPSIGSYGGPSEGSALQEDSEPSGRLEKPSIASYGSMSEGRALQEDSEPSERLEKPLSSEDGNQNFFSSLSLNFSRINMAQLTELPADLQSLRIERYASNMLPKEILERSSLQYLYIIDSIPLKIFPLSPSLKTLYIHNCKSLEFPQPNKVMNQVLLLEDICLGSSCDSLKIFPLNYFPKLKALSLWDCRNLECLSIEKELQTELTSLDSLEIKDCPKFRSFLEVEFQAPNLTSLVFFNCGSLKSLQGVQSFKSLQSLYINKCPALESLPKEGFPSSLVILCISFCDKITPQKEWNLDKLHSLSHFEIEGGCQNLKSFPEAGLLPTNLNSLRISRLVNLTSLDREGLQKLTSLQTLEINCCNKLDSLPEHRLPSSLSSLSITDCSLLNPKLQNRKGKEWFKIAHIPSIHLDEVSD